jgi:hypothetical protein
MRTNLKVILAAAAIAVLASPVMAESASHPPAAPAASIANARGSVAHTRTNRLAPAAAVQGSQIRLDDCIHVTFPQCDGDATLTQVDRP